MLTAEQNEELTQVAAGTPMGELLRRYWYPVAFTRELEEFPVRPARLLGEDFAVFKTPRGLDRELLELAGERDRVPVAPQQLAHGGARGDLGQLLVLFGRQHWS